MGGSWQARCSTDLLLTFSCRTSSGSSRAVAAVEGGLGSGWLPAPEVGVCAHRDRLGEFQAHGLCLELPFNHGQGEVLRGAAWPLFRKLIDSFSPMMVHFDLRI
jgi:hypothetical protein